MQQFYKKEEDHNWAEIWVSSSCRNCDALYDSFQLQLVSLFSHVW